MTVEDAPPGRRSRQSQQTNGPLLEVDHLRVLFPIKSAA